jgi:hypothetical protein
LSGRRTRAAVLETEIAVRANVPRTRPQAPRRPAPRPTLVLVLDTETRTDAAQALLFGSFRVYELGGRLRQEGLFYPDDLSFNELQLLEGYVATHAADNGGHLRLLPRRRFLRHVLWPIGYKARARIVAYNMPFDCSRLAFAWRRANNGGFTLHLWDSIDEEGVLWPDRYRPTVRIKAFGSKRQFTSYGSPATLDPDLKEDGYVWPGDFLDLHTLVYALTDKSLSLDAAAKRFGLPAGKAETEEHGVLTEAYIDYNRQDVRLTWELHQVLTEEWARHPIDLAPEQAYSPAAVSKAYLREAGITLPAERSAVPADRLGQAMSAYYGGRAEVHIRRVPLPVRYADFTSMYATVFALMGLWRWVIAERLSAIGATGEAQALLAAATREALHDPAIWPRLAGVFCRVLPDGELLPVRARYGAPDGRATGAWTIGLNELVSRRELWYTLADLVVARLLGTTTPTILEAFRVVPEGRLPDLRLVHLRGTIPVDPAQEDLFRLATEERARVKGDSSLPWDERKRLAQFLKTFANGGAYGIFAEVRQLDPARGGAVVRADGLWPIEARVATPEEPGAFCFPPLAATVTGGARLLLALLQADVEARGGTYVTCDTDSLLIVSSATGGLLACPGGPERLADGTEAVRALSWAAVDEVLGGLGSLSPYKPGTIADLVKLEPQNFAVGDPTRPEELFCLATSAKRYVLYNRTDGGMVVRKASVHGLGLSRSPLRRNPDWDPEKEWPEWVEVVWQRIIAEAEDRDPGPEPDWFGLPAVSQLPVSSPLVLSPFRELNEDKPYSAQVKPFGFLLAGHVDPLAPLPEGLAPGDVIPVAPFTSKPGDLLSLEWRNRRDGSVLKVTTRPRGQPGHVRLKTHGDLVTDYRLHPETKSGDPRGGLGRRGSVGLLPRLRVVARGVPVHIGKESNHLDEVEDGIITDPDEVYVEYRDERREWEAVLPALRALRDERGWRYLAEASGLSERAVRYALNGATMPHRPARSPLLRLLATSPAEPPADHPANHGGLVAKDGTRSGSRGR